jgi:FMN phosphatase YigB (HAD superfamily)
MGLRDCFTSLLYGPDLVEMPKHHPDFYRRVFEHAGVDPDHALVVDDSAQALERAKAAGAATVHVARDGGGPGEHPAIGSLAELPSLLRGWNDGKRPSGRH